MTHRAGLYPSPLFLMANIMGSTVKEGQGERAQEYVTRS